MVGIATDKKKTETDQDSKRACIIITAWSHLIETNRKELNQHCFSAFVSPGWWLIYWALLTWNANLVKLTFNSFPKCFCLSCPLLATEDAHSVRKPQFCDEVSTFCATANEQWTMSNEQWAMRSNCFEKAAVIHFLPRRIPSQQTPMSCFMTFVTLFNVNGCLVASPFLCVEKDSKSVWFISIWRLFTCLSNSHRKLGKWSRIEMKMLTIGVHFNLSCLTCLQFARGCLASRSIGDNCADSFGLA